VKTFFDWTATDDPGTVIDVRQPGAWEALRDSYSVKGSSSQLNQVIALSRGHGVQSVVVEFRYIDLDYRSEHSSFYGTTFRRYPSVCHRLHFFADVVAADLSNLHP